MAATPKPIRKAISKHMHENKEFLKKHNPAPTKQHEKKTMKKMAKHEKSMHIHETPKHEKIRKERSAAHHHMKKHGG